MEVGGEPPTKECINAPGRPKIHFSVPNLVCYSNRWMNFSLSGLVIVIQTDVTVEIDCVILSVAEESGICLNDNRTVIRFRDTPHKMVTGSQGQVHED